MKEEVATKSTTVSKDASSQTTDIESRESSSMVADKNKVRRRAAIGLGSLDEQKKKKVNCSPYKFRFTISLSRNFLILNSKYC